MNPAFFLPWHIDIAQTWLQNRDRYAHAWLIHGLPGIGKFEFAKAAAMSLLCQTAVEGLACGQCEACAWVLAGHHPDLRWIQPDALAESNSTQTLGSASLENPSTSSSKSSSKTTLSKEIRIDQIRALETWFNLTTHRGGERIAVFYPAQALNKISAHALLKVLEEPPEHTIFLLIADAPDLLLPTLVSRCRRFPLPIPPSEQALSWLSTKNISAGQSWLDATGGAPISAWRLAQNQQQPCPKWVIPLLESLSIGRCPDIGHLTETIEKMPASEWIDILQRVYVDLSLIMVKLNPRYFLNLKESLRKISQRSQRIQIAQEGRWLTRQRAQATYPLNAKLFIHTVLQRLVHACLGIEVT